MTQQIGIFSRFVYFWQHIPENIDPVIFQIGWLKVHYYGLMYLVAFAVVYFLVKYRIKNEKKFAISGKQVEDLTVNLILGLIIGGRLGYVIIYNLPYYINNPLEIILPFSFNGKIEFTGISGMSYHGGLIGTILACFLYAKRNKLSFIEAAELYVPAIPLGYTFGRLGNFFNGELFGRTTESFIGMYFPFAMGDVARHPSQLYEAFFEGIFLFIILWSIRKKVSVPGRLLSFYIIGYGLVRFFIEFFREPDLHIGFVLMQFTTGQVLCFLMVIFGLILNFIFNYKSRKVTKWN